MFTTYKEILVQYDHGLFMIFDYIARGKQLALDQPRIWKNILSCWVLEVFRVLGNRCTQCSLNLHRKGLWFFRTTCKRRAIASTQKKKKKREKEQQQAQRKIVTWKGTTISTKRNNNAKRSNNVKRGSNNHTKRSSSTWKGALTHEDKQQAKRSNTKHGKE
jgi:uncharacterized Zn finger protein (UPF0148 family)